MPRRVFRAHRLAAISTQADRGGPPAPRRLAVYWCAGDHRTAVPFAADVEAPLQWLCYSCGAPAGPERGDAPLAVRPRVFPRSSYEFLMMRRTEADGDRLLAEAVAALRRQRRVSR
jgi:hypothetical protein